MYVEADLPRSVHSALSVRSIQYTHTRADPAEKGADVAEEGEGVTSLLVEGDVTEGARIVALVESAEGEEGEESCVCCRELCRKVGERRAECATWKAEGEEGVGERRVGVEEDEEGVEEDGDDECEGERRMRGGESADIVTTTVLTRPEEATGVGAIFLCDVCMLVCVCGVRFVVLD